ncbi:CheR family methyltransferase [Puniceibacterium sediminis]|uniref:Chemotaxis protein methyltransferase n=1 Tax=Puniceibacterium sediminis TaxID=1608407 RepID=A0A238Y194_9RHOB|nr:protein-glutamate O-methyltransferase [Puniceibacterium sediminis]SNR64069.1 chemotaxis protein methyltransferase CheR [Puniceibacterium sediminis]
MTSAQTTKPVTSEFPFTDADFAQIANVAKSEFGLNLALSKKPLVYSRLAKRLRLRKLSTFQEYLSLLSDINEDAEKTELLSALTTNVTHFFREFHHFETLNTTVLPALLTRAKNGDRIRIWSAGCSSGQEPYSLALSVLGAFPDASRYDIKILATDIDPNILDRACQASYPKSELEAIPDAMHRFLDLKSGDPNNFTIGEAARNLVSFGVLNLISDWPIKGPFDVIFCRNVTIYFDAETQRHLWTRFQNALSPSGHLFIGHSERVTGTATQAFRSIGVTSYQKNQPTVNAAGN